MPKLLSVNVGLPREIEWNGKVVRTGIWKQPVSGRVFARRLNLDGDGQGDLGGHGGEQRAVMVYQLEAYRYWGRELGRNDRSEERRVGKEGGYRVGADNDRETNRDS